jgi:signal transduction histidine kinase
VDFREQLLAVVGHDLRNPLNAIAASAFQLARSPQLPERDLRAVERIRRSTARMTRMIDDILDFARCRLGGGLPVDRQRMNLAEACQVALEELQVIHPARRLVFEARGDTWGEWDPDRVAQVLGNLVSNALQHGGTDSPVRVTVSDAGPDILLEVHNHGEPIPLELHARLFDPFKGGGRGLGLGLHIVHQIVRAHGGEVEVRSSAEDGTTLTVRWPRGPPASQAEHVEPSPPLS